MANRLIVRVMGTIASQLKALSQNTPQSSIILYLGVSPGSWVLSGREYHRQLSLVNPYSVLFQNLQLFCFWDRAFNWLAMVPITLTSNLPPIKLQLGCTTLTQPMLRLLSSKAQGCKDF